MAKDSVMYLFASLLSFYSLILLPIFLVVCAYKLTCRLHKLLGKSRSNMAGKDILRRGLFRVWFVMSGGWITLCAFEFANLPGNCYVPKCDLFVRVFFTNSFDYSVDDGFFAVGKAAVGMPAIILLFCLALYWVIDGFRRSHSS